MARLSPAPLPHAPVCTRRIPAPWLLLLLVVSAHLTHAQEEESSPHGSSRDSVFRLIGTNIANWEVARDLLLDYTREYSPKDPEGLPRYIAAPAATPYDSVRQAFYRHALAQGFRIITPVEGVGIDLKAARVQENYARVDDTLFHNLYLKQVGDWGVYDTVMGGLAFGITAPGNGGDPVLLAGGPSYTSHYAFFYGDPTYYRRAGLPDRSTWFRFSAALKISDAALADVREDEPLGAIILYRRTRRNQHDCRCWAFEPIDTIAITRRSYLASPPADVAGYRDLGRTFDMVRGTGIYTFDSVTALRVPVFNRWGRRIGERDSVISRDTLYRQDTVVGEIIARYTVLDTITPGRPARHLTVRRDSIRLLHVPLRKRDPLDWLHGDGSEWWGPPTCPPDDCRERLRRGELGPDVVLEEPDFSDFTFRLYSTRRVPITFLRSRINQDLYDQLLAGRLDSGILRPSVERIYASDTLNRLLGLLAYSDETTFHKYRGDGALARRLQDFMMEQGDSTRELWCNPVSNYDAFRFLSGDLDSARLRTVHMIARQDYNQIGGIWDRIPIFHANPDSMSRFGSEVTYRPLLRIVASRRGDSLTYDSVFADMIAGHSIADYATYNETRQRGWGSYRASQGIEGTRPGATVTTLARAVEAAKFRYRGRAHAPKVWNTIQDMGWRELHDAHDLPADTGAIYRAWSSRPPTPEEVTCQGWLSLNCGVDGLVYTDAQIDPPNFGFVHLVSGRPDRDYQEWLPEHGLRRTREDSVRYLQPSIWTGFRGRYDAVRRMNREIRLLDSIVHLTGLRFDRKQISVHDTAQIFATMPLLDTVMAEQAERYIRAVDGRFVGSGTTDARRETFMEISHFLASPRDSYPDAHYFIITNRRCWPVDTISYGPMAMARGAEMRGLGAIDVRRPVLRFRKEGMEEGSLIVEKVGHEDEWPSRIVTPGELIPLDWITPGWGAVYRVRAGTTLQ